MLNIGRFLVGACAGGVLFCLAAPAQAETKFEIGGRIGYGIPFGGAREDAKLHDLMVGQIPIWLDIGARFAGHYYLGAYLSYGFGINGSTFSHACDADRKATGADISCRTYSARIGIQYAYHIKPPGELDPWLGVGAGYEWFGATESAGGASLNGDNHGWEFVNFQLGLDVPTSKTGSVGPFATFALGKYTTASIGNGDNSLSQEIPNKALHEWLFLGVRGTFVM